MRLRAALPVLAAAFALAPAAAAPPSDGVLFPGESLAGIELGMTKADVLRLWGKRHGVCRECLRETWYFNYRPFHPEGAGVVFRRSRVVRVFTVWRPRGWRTVGGLSLGAPQAEISDAAVVVDERHCVGYEALVAPGRSAQTVFYAYRGKLWGFALVRAGANPCL
ncbi:MAG: hypothetical protein M3304_09160 [Actinomycetota bacterium]|nr:hypothetical protein [Actinomycetota bacterium]